MPNRIIREGILTSPRISKLGWAEEVFYRRLMSVVDDFGRYFANEGLLRAHCYPRQLNKVSDSDVGKWLHSCVAAGLVRVYSAQDGESYLELLNFGQQVRAKKSKYPDPITSDSKCYQVPEDAHLDVSVSVSELKPTHNAHEPEAVGLPVHENPTNTLRTVHQEDWQPDLNRLAHLLRIAGQAPPENLPAVLIEFNLHYSGKLTTENQRYQKLIAWQKREKPNDNKNNSGNPARKRSALEIGDAIGDEWLRKERERERIQQEQADAISRWD